MPKGWSDEEIETAARMYAAGESYTRIGQEIKKSRDAVRYYLRAHSELFPAPLEEKDILLDKLTVKAEETPLAAGTDYTAAFDDNGYVNIVVIPGGAGADTPPKEMPLIWIR